MNTDHNISQEDWEKIEAYLSGTMDPTEAAAFARQAAENPVLQQQINESRLLLLGIKEAALMDKLSSFHEVQETPVRKIKPSTQKRVFWLAAASIILVVFSVSLILWFSNNKKTDELFAGYFEPDPGLPTVMGTGGAYQFNRGMIDYKTGNYSAAIEAWRPLLHQQTGKDTLNYFLGLSFLSLKNSDSAIHYLRNAHTDSEGALHNDAGWYLALALLKENKKEEALNYLKQVNHPRKDELLLKLNK